MKIQTDVLRLIGDLIAVTDMALQNEDISDEQEEVIERVRLFAYTLNHRPVVIEEGGAALPS